MTDRGRERSDPPPEQEAAVLGLPRRQRRYKTTSTSAGRQRVIHHNVDPTEQEHIYRGTRTHVEGAVVKTKAEWAVFLFFFLLHGENEGAEGLRYALLSGLSVPQRADWAAAHEG